MRLLDESAETDRAVGAVHADPDRVAIQLERQLRHRATPIGRQQEPTPHRHCGAEEIDLAVPSEMSIDESRLNVVRREFAYAWLRKRL